MNSSAYEVRRYLWEVKRQEQAVADALADAQFMVPDWVEFGPDSVMPIRQAVALSCSINPRFAAVVEHVHGDGEVGEALKALRRRLDFMTVALRKSLADRISLLEMESVAREVGWQLPQGFPVRPASKPSAESSGPARELPMTRAALVKAYVTRWTTIQADIKDAANNGLRAAAGSESRGWFASKAVAWADSKGKLKPLPEPSLDQVLHGRG